MFGNYTDLVLVVVIATQAAIIYLIILGCSADNENKILMATNKNLEKENNTLRFSIPRLTKLTEQLVNNDKERTIQVQQIQRYLGEVLEISDLIGFDNKDFNAADVIEELKAKVKWAEERRKYQMNQDENNYYDPN